MSILFRLLGYAARHRTMLCLTAALGLAGVAAELARPWPVKIIVDHVLAGHPLPGWLASWAALLPGAGIARAVLKDAPVLVLDEPTSALDAHTEGKIFEALSRLMKDRTTFIISHRLSTIRRADQILALEDGRIVERGTHESLPAAGRTYAHLYERQHIAAL